MILSGTYVISDNPNVHVSSFTQPKLTLAMANLVTEVAQVNCSLGAKTHPDSANLGSQLKHGFALARPGVTVLVPM